MIINNKILGIIAFIAYFMADTFTTCAAVYLYSANAESNPAMFAAIDSYGLLGFIALKLIISLCIIVPSYILSIRQATHITGISALIAITMGGAVVSLNNAVALLTGTSIFYQLFGNGSFLGPGVIVGFAMLVAGLLIYGIMNKKEHDHKPGLH
jgi:hypothetical protein